MAGPQVGRVRDGLIAAGAIRRDEAPHTRGYSAYGEDIIILSWLQALGIAVERATYLDVGAAHPYRLSNTALLYRHGARGVLVEPDPDQAKALRARRPRDTVLNVGVAFDDRRSANLIRMKDAVFNTFDAGQASKVVDASQGWRPDQVQSVRDEMPIELRPINDIIDRDLSGTAPDFLSIDVEANDLNVLKQLDMRRFKPVAICVEASTPVEQFNDLLAPYGYELMATTPDNFIFIRRGG